MSLKEHCDSGGIPIVRATMVKAQSAATSSFDCVVCHLIYSHQLVEPISHLSQMLQI